jgi:hypothetical protein
MWWVAALIGGTMVWNGPPMSTTTHGRIQDALNVLRELVKLLVEP